MKAFLVMVVFGVPAALVLLAIGGDLRLSGPQEPPQIPVEEETEPPEPIESVDSPIQQKIFNWEYRHFDPELGVFDWFARGTEAIPRRGQDTYDVVKPQVQFCTFTKTTQLRWETKTQMDAGKGEIKFEEKYVFAKLTGEVAITCTEVNPETGITTMELHTGDLDLKAANRREGSDVPAAQFHTASPVRLTGPGFEVRAGGGMSGATQLNRITLGPPVEMDLITHKSGVFFGRGRAQGGDRSVHVEGRGPLLVERQPERNVFFMSLSGGVVVSDGDISVSSDTLGVAIGRSRAVELATAGGDIVVKQGEEPHLFGGRAKWDIRTGRTVLSGARGVKFVDGNNILVARTATLLEDRKRLLLEGGVEAWLEGTITDAESKKGRGSFPRQWRVFCDSAEVHLAAEGSSLKARYVLLKPLAGSNVIVRSADGAYEARGGSVEWDAEHAAVEIRENPELSRGESERVSSNKVRLNLNDGTILFEKEVAAKFTAGSAAWKFQAGLMKAKLSLREGRSPAITSVTLTSPGGRVLVDYARTGGGEVRLLAGRVSWDAATQVALLDSGNRKQLQRLQHARDWIEARKVVFEPRLKKALFEDDVRAHMEQGPSPGGQAPRAEPPFEVTCEKLSLDFDDRYETKSALAEGSVKFTGSSGGITLGCERARYARGEKVTFEGKARPELAAGENRLSARKIVVYLLQERIVLEGKITGRFDDGKGARMTMSCSQMHALYNQASGAITQIYFSSRVHMETESARAGHVTLDGQRAVYQVEQALVSLTGKPVIIRRGNDRLREKKVVYDLKNKVLITGPTEKGYDWELDPSGWKKKGNGH